MITRWSAKSDGPCKGFELTYNSETAIFAVVDPDGAEVCAHAAPRAATKALGAKLDPAQPDLKIGQAWSNFRHPRTGSVATTAADPNAHKVACALATTRDGGATILAALGTASPNADGSAKLAALVSAHAGMAERIAQAREALSEVKAQHTAAVAALATLPTDADTASMVAAVREIQRLAAKLASDAAEIEDNARAAILDEVYGPAE